MFARLVGVLRAADQLDHLVDIGDGDGETDQHVGAIARLAEEVLGAPVHHLLAEGDEGADKILEVHHQRPAAVERHHVGAERGLQRGEAVELVEHHVRHRIAPQLDHDAVAVAVGFIAQRRDSFDLLLAHQFADALDHVRLVHLVGNLGDDDRLAVTPEGLEFDLAAHHDRAAAEMIGGTDALAAENNSARREIGTGHDADQVFDREARIVDQRHAGIDHLAEIVRRDVGRHTDGDAAGAVDQEIGKTRRQHHRLALGIVVVGLEIDRVLVEVLDQRAGHAFETHLGVTHRRRRVAVDRAEIALAIDQRQAHGEILRHAYQGVIDRLITVRMIFADNVADDARRLAVWLVPLVAILVHREEDAPMHRLEPVARVGQSARHDYAHGVIEVALLHFLRDRDGANIGRAAIGRREVVLV